MMATTIERKGEMAVIEGCLQLTRVAVVGISRQEADFSRTVWKELKKQGYDLVPVNPQATEIDGVKCYNSVLDIKPAVDWVLLMTTPQISEQVVRECVEAGIKRIWFHRGGGAGAVSQAALELCAREGIQVVPGECPFMFLPNPSFVHKFHGFTKKLTGGYPR